MLETRCNCFPGHSKCWKKINKGNCPGEEKGQCCSRQRANKALLPVKRQRAEDALRARGNKALGGYMFPAGIPGPTD